MDYGHGNNCPGKCSPDKSFYEWRFTHDVGREITARLRDMGHHVVETWSHDYEPLSDPHRVCTSRQLRDALNYRWRQANLLCKRFGTRGTLLVSVHVNAAGGDGKWHDARGYQVMVGTKASAASKRLARLIYDEADAAGLRGNRAVPAAHCWTQQLAMCDYTLCPAVLTESLFYDNRDDLAILQSAAGREKIIAAHIGGITKYLKNL